MISAFDIFGNVKQIGPDEVAESGPLLDDLCRRVEEGPSEPYGTLMSVWIALTHRVVGAGTPAQLVVDTATRIVVQATCAGQA